MKSFPLYLVWRALVRIFSPVAVIVLVVYSVWSTFAPEKADEPVAEAPVAEQPAPVEPADQPPVTELPGVQGESLPETPAAADVPAAKEAR